MLLDVRGDSGDGLAALKEAYAARGRATGGQEGGCLVLDGRGRLTEGLLASFERHVTGTGGVFIAGAWREGLMRPFGALLDVVDGLAERVFPTRPELLRRYSLTLVNLLPAWRRVEAFRKVGELRSGLADFVLHGDRAGLKDFYWKRNVAPLVAADLLRFTLDAVAALAHDAGAPLVLCFMGAHAADQQTVELLQLLGNYSRRRPVLLCVTARELTPALQSRLLEGSPSWHVVDAEDGDALDSGDFNLMRLAAGHRRLAEAASVLALPFEAHEIEALLPNEREAAVQSVDALVEQGVWRRCGASRFSFRSPELRDAVYSGINDERRRRLHAAALGVEQVDPYAAAWHAAEAELSEEFKSHSLKAAERAWAVSDYSTAVRLAEHFVAASDAGGAQTDGGGAQVSGDLLLALLHYDAGQYEATERHLAIALADARSDSLHDTILERLLGYNAIFGLGDFERGRRIMESVLESFEARGLYQDAGYVRNTIAYTLFCTRRFDDAVEMEKTALKLLESSDRAGGFLYSVLQLNLGRLYRTLGFQDQALRLFRNGLEAPDMEQSPYMLLIFHTTLAQLYVSRGEYAHAAAAFQHCLGLSRDLELENASDPVLNSLARPVGKLLSDRTTRGDEVFFYIYLNLALAYRRLGLSALAETYLSGMKACWGFLGEDVWRAAEDVLAGAVPAVETSASDSVVESDEEVEEAGRRFEGLVFEAAGPEQAALDAAAALAEKKVLAVTGPRAVGAGVHTFDGLVLYDPREPELAGRINAEVGAYGSPRARTALILPEAAGLFDGGVEPLPLVLQDATLKAEHHAAFGALVPYRSRVQVLSPEFDGPLFRILSEFARRTGTGALAAVPFHLRGRDLATTAGQALSAFLISSVDHLMHGGRLLSKTWGAEADENIMPFCPRMSRNASIFSKSENGDTETFLLLVRTWSFHNYLKLSRAMRPVLDLCDGRRSVADIVRLLEADSPADARLEQRTCAFFRKLWRQGAVVFDDPLVRRPEAVASHV
jgi:tetratricopeptide (TPR) repeat protein